MNKRAVRARARAHVWLCACPRQHVCVSALCGAPRACVRDTAALSLRARARARIWLVGRGSTRGETTTTPMQPSFPLLLPFRRPKGPKKRAEEGRIARAGLRFFPPADAPCLCIGSHIINSTPPPPKMRPPAALSFAHSLSTNTHTLQKEPSASFDACLALPPCGLCGRLKFDAARAGFGRALRFLLGRPQQQQSRH